MCRSRYWKLAEELEPVDTSAQKLWTVEVGQEVLVMVRPLFSLIFVNFASAKVFLVQLLCVV